MPMTWRTLGTPRRRAARAPAKTASETEYTALAPCLRPSRSSVSALSRCRRRKGPRRLGSSVRGKVRSPGRRSTAAQRRSSAGLASASGGRTTSTGTARSGMRAQDALVGLHQALRVPLGGEVPLRVRSRGRPQARAELGVGEEPLEGRGQDGGRARRDEEPRAPGEEDASARGRSGRDDRTTRGGGFEDGPAELGAPGGRDDDVRHAVEGRRVLGEGDERDRVVEAQAAHEPPGLRLVVAREVERLDDAAERRREERRPADVAADDQEPGGEAAAAEERGRLDEVAVPLGWVEEAEEAGDRDAGGDAERAPLRRGRSGAE